MNLGELWIDRSDASEHIAALDVSAETAAHLRFFWENGYTIFRNVVPGELIDKIVDGMLSVSKDPKKYVVRREGKYADPLNVTSLGPGGRVIDIYGVSSAARDAVYQRPVAEWRYSKSRPSPCNLSASNTALSRRSTKIRPTSSLPSRSVSLPLGLHWKM